MEIGSVILLGGIFLVVIYRSGLSKEFKENNLEFYDLKKWSSLKTASSFSSFRKFLNRKGQPFSDCPLKRNTLSVTTMLVADLPALIWYLAHTSACFNKATAHIQISPVGFIVNVIL